MKKRKSGYDYLKERLAELEEKFNCACEECKQNEFWYAETSAKLQDARENAQRHIEHYHWLYKHAPFWLKWWYCKHFFGK